jgi:hypothetical protein
LIIYHLNHQRVKIVKKFYDFTPLKGPANGGTGNEIKKANKINGYIRVSNFQDSAWEGIFVAFYK